MKQQRTTTRWFLQAVLAFALLVPAAAAFAQAGGETAPMTGAPAGIDESEYGRLRRPVAGGPAAPEFLSPEALKGLSQEVIEAIQKDFEERGRIQVQSEGFLDYDEERNIIYSSARTRIRFDRYMLEADRVLVHVPLQEIQADGNVIIRAWRDPALTEKVDEINADSIIFNYRYFQGAGYNVRGQHDVLYFKAPTTAEGQPGFRVVGRDEVVLRNVEFTTSDFPDPQYSIRTRDAVLVTGDRLFLQRATLYVRHIPVFWLPAYTRSLRERFPWHVTFGRSSRLGTYVNVRYNFWHYRYEPSFEDPDDLVLRNRGHAVAKFDFYSERGPGLGLEYEYGFNFEKHFGITRLYALPSDSGRKVPEDEGGARWQVFSQHRSELTDNLIFQSNIDYMSDPEMYYDIFDEFSTGREDRRRVPERRARAALTYWKDDYIARVLVDAKERITRDRITNTAEPTDDDFDYDFDPLEENFDRDRFRRGEGIPSSRYGLVSLRLPQVQFSTNHIRVGGQAPLFYAVDLNVINNLDKGLNFQDADDDSFVQGFDLYQNLSYLFKFTERYTLLAQVGAGLGVMNRADDSFNWEFPDDFLREDGTLRNDIGFVDDKTFVTTGGREISLSDTNPAFFYGDARLRFQGRFTDSLTGNVYYIIREGSDDSLSEWYESIGNRTARQDLYDYRIRKHWITADLTHRLMSPNITSYLAAGRNLQSQSDIFSNELIQYAAIGNEYRNAIRTVRVRTYARYDQYQLRDPSDPFEYQRDSLLAGVGGEYAPVHRRWWVEGDLYVWKALNDDPAGDDQLERDFYRDLFDSNYRNIQENDTDVILRGWVGRKIGEKWVAELGAEYQTAYSGFRNARLILSRDLNNAVFQFQARYRNRPWRAMPTDLDLRFTISFKLPGPLETMRAPRVQTLMTERRRLEIAEDTAGL